MEIDYTIFEEIAKAIGFLLLYIILFLISKWMKDFFTPYKLNEELTQKDNLAVSFPVAGYYLAGMFIFIGALRGPTQGFWMDLVTVGGYSLLGLVFLNLSRFLNDKLILRKFCNIEQLTIHKNVAVGIVLFGTYTATGLITAASITGQGGGVATALVFFLLGQLSLVVFERIYEWITPYSIHEELELKNIAAATAFSGTIIALGVIIMNSIAADFISWQSHLTEFLILNVTAFVFLPITRLIIKSFVIFGASLDDEIIKDQNLSAGILEAVIIINLALILQFLL